MSESLSRTQRTIWPSLSTMVCAGLALLIFAPQSVSSFHHMKTRPPEDLMKRQSGSTPLIISNQCGSTIWPGVLTQSGDGPPVNGFALSSGSQRSFFVSKNWQGRVWARTNCSFDSGGESSVPCGTGDCGTNVNCIGTGEVPTTLAEFTMDAGDGHTYYDLSLVDGYNLPMAVEMLPQSNGSFEAIPQRLTNPSCVATVSEASPINYNPYTTDSTFLGTTAQQPIRFEGTETLADIAQWCPFDLQVSTSTGPSGGVYVYPDGQLDRPAFDPCYSACARYNLPQDCCTGAYDSPSACTPSAYSKAAKAVCPDAYSYAFDDQTSTFIIPAGAGFEVIFCPGGRSTNIIATSHNELVQLAQTGTVDSKMKRQTPEQVSELFYIGYVVNNNSALAIATETTTANFGRRLDARRGQSMVALVILVGFMVWLAW